MASSICFHASSVAFFIINVISSPRKGCLPREYLDLALLAMGVYTSLACVEKILVLRVRISENECDPECVVAHAWLLGMTDWLLEVGLSRSGRFLPFASLLVSLTSCAPFKTTAFPHHQGEPLRDWASPAQQDDHLHQRAVRHGSHLQHPGPQTGQADHSTHGRLPHEKPQRWWPRPSCQAPPLRGFRLPRADVPCVSHSHLRDWLSVVGSVRMLGHHASIVHIHSGCGPSVCIDSFIHCFFISVFCVCLCCCIVSCFNNN